MDYKGWGTLLNGRVYGSELSKTESEAAKKDGVVIVFGASDDLCEFRGAIDDEAGCYGSGLIALTHSGLFQSLCGDDDCPYALAEKQKCSTIKAVWCDSDSPYSWTYQTNIPHASFDILADGELYCRGVAFSISCLQQQHGA